MIDVEGSIVTIDAMGCQKEIVKSICEAGADYVIGLKGNQESLHEIAKTYFDENETPQTVTNDYGHGRTETREYHIATDIIDFLWQKEDWENFRAFGMVKSTVIENNKTREETRYFITSLINIDDFACSVRKHWSIENQLHWRLDVAFREDSAKAKKDISPLNMNVLRKIALSLLNQANMGRIGLRKKMFKAALNVDVLEYIVFGEK